MKEIWKDIEGYEGLYQVSNFGMVKSLERIDSIGRKKSSRILKLHYNSQRYLNITLFNSEGRKYFLVHRLVAQAFIPNPGNLPQINHIDEDRVNNRVDNLEWCSSKYNLNYGNRRKKANESSKKPIISISPEGVIRREGSATDFSKRTGIDVRNINAVLKGRRRHTHGYRFRYIKELHTNE